MDRRNFLRLLTSAAVGAATFDPERLLWTPRVMITVPAMPANIRSLSWALGLASRPLNDDLIKTLRWFESHSVRPETLGEVIGNNWITDTQSDTFVLWKHGQPPVRSSGTWLIDHPDCNEPNYLAPQEGTIGAIERSNQSWRSSTIK